VFQDSDPSFCRLAHHSTSSKPLIYPSDYYFEPS
jgi:hypothetical protein